MNKANISILPPLLENDVFSLHFKAKAQIFNDYFLHQSATFGTGSHVPISTEGKISKWNNIGISHEKIIRVIRSLNPSKAHDCDEISVLMIKISNNAVALTLKIIFGNCIENGIFPEIRKIAKIFPVHEKNSKNLKQNYCPISLHPNFRKNFYEDNL